MTKQIFVHFHCSEIGGFTIGCNEYSYSNTPSDFNYDEIETLPIEEASKKYPNAIGMKEVLDGDSSLPAVF